MFYAIIGMPLFLLYLSNIGDIMAKMFKWFYSRCCQCKRKRKRRKSVRVARRSNNNQIYELDFLERRSASLTSSVRNEDDGERKAIDMDNHDHNEGREIALIEGDQVMLDDIDEEEGIEDEEEEYEEYSEDMSDDQKQDLSSVTVPISLCLFVMISYICGGAVLFGEWEGWGFLDGSYFCFITLSTIGFGDMVPGDSLGDDADLDEESDGQGGVMGLVNVQFIFCSMYILLGMAVIAMCFNLMQEKVVQGITSFGKKLGIIKDEE